jgi:predicted ATPase
LKVRFVVETHSVYLIQRLQLLAARKEFDPEKVDILYFNKSDEKEKFYKITLRDDGILDQGFGTGFYDETANLTADILNARKMN